MSDQLELEIPEIKKKRTTLKEQHFISAKGLPYLSRKLIKEQKLRKALHSKTSTSYDKLTKLLVFYQLWGHKLYPRMGFEEFLKSARRIGQGAMVRNLRESIIRQEMGAGDDFSTGSGGPGAPGPAGAPAAVPQPAFDDGDDDLFEESLFVRDTQAEKEQTTPQDDEIERQIAEYEKFNMIEDTLFS